MDWLGAGKWPRSGAWGLLCAAALAVPLAGAVSARAAGPEDDVLGAVAAAIAQPGRAYADPEDLMWLLAWFGPTRAWSDCPKSQGFALSASRLPQVLAGSATFDCPADRRDGPILRRLLIRIASTAVNDAADAVASIDDASHNAPRCEDTIGYPGLAWCPGMGAEIGVRREEGGSWVFEVGALAAPERG